MRWWVSLAALLVLTGAVPVQNTMVTVANNAALRATSVAAAKTVLRAGFTSPGDGGAAVYTASTAACTAADNGAQVATTVGTGCWIADFSVARPTPKIWGAKGDGVTDDTAAIQAAMNALAYNTLYIDASLYVSGPLACSAPIDIQGREVGSWGGGSSGFRPRTLNQNLFNFGWACNGSSIIGVYFDWGHLGTNTSGTVFTTTGREVKFNYNVISGACNGINESGNSNLYIGNTVAGIYGNACNAITVGQSTTYSGTIDPIFANNNLFSDPSFANPGHAAFLLLDTGGAMITNNNSLYFQYGMLIAPDVISSSPQYVLYTYITQNASDTDTIADFAIIPGNANTIVDSIECIGCWMANAGGSGAPSGGPPVLIDNRSNAAVMGLRFRDSRIYPAQNYDGVHVIPGTVAETIQGLSFDATTICSAQVSSGTGIRIDSPNITNFALRNSYVGGCDHLGGTSMAIGISLTGGPRTFGQNYIITGNNFVTSVTPISWIPGSLGTPEENAIVKDNQPLQGLVGVASAAVTNLGFNENIAISGSAAIATMQPVWGNREVNIFNQSGGTWTLAPGGNICPGGPVSPATNYLHGVWVGCWALK